MTESTEVSERIASGEAQSLFKEVKKWRIGKIGEKFKSQLRQEKSNVRKLINCITELGKNIVERKIQLSKPCCKHN